MLDEFVFDEDDAKLISQISGGVLDNLHLHDVNGDHEKLKFKNKSAGLYFQRPRK